MALRRKTRGRLLDDANDVALLTADDAQAADAFATFYRRHLPLVLGFTLRRLDGDRELAADVTAEVFAKALAARGRFDPARGDARAWLCTIAARTISDSRRRGRVEDDTRRRIGIEPIELHDRDLERVDELASTDTAELDRLDSALAALPADTRRAVQRRVVDEASYAEIADELELSESVIRKRVSRGLGRLREDLQGAP